MDVDRVTRDAALAALLTAVAFLVGLTLPDMDLALGLTHRNGVTHSAAPALLAAGLPRWRAAGCGLAGGVAFHLAADVFPNRMIGFALVKLPFVGALHAAESRGWLLLNAVVAGALALWLARRLHAPDVASGLFAGAGVLGAAYLWRTDGGWPVLAIAAALAWLAWRVRR